MSEKLSEHDGVVIVKLHPTDVKLDRIIELLEEIRHFQSEQLSLMQLMVQR